ncbi:MAG: hypothetical protein HUU02_10660 [Bacteroidetes bacterium]|nr:hypothetical protein [Bacteroidota bacterium]
MRTYTVFISTTLLLLGCSGGLHSPNELASLQEITLKGHMLYEYDVASWIASDAVIAQHPDPNNLQYFLAKKDQGQWTVVFGKQHESDKAFLISYEVAIAKDFTSHSMKEYSPPMKDTGWYANAAIALQHSLRDFGASEIKYNYYVLADTSGIFSVYLVPAQTSSDIIPLGGDVCYSVDAQGTGIITKTKLHNSIIAMPKASENTTAGMHTHVLIPTPVETDILYVLRQKPRVQHYVVSSKHIFVIGADGRIRISTER